MRKSRLRVVLRRRRRASGWGRAATRAAAQPLRLRIGYACSAQEVAVAPSEPWDQALDTAVTERGIRRFRHG